MPRATYCFLQHKHYIQRLTQHTVECYVLMSGRGFQAGVLQLFRNIVQEKQEDDTIDLQVGKTVHSDVPRHMRTELWMSVLLRKGSGTAASQQYRRMLAKVR